MIKHEIEIINKLGLHARASTKLTQTASIYNSDIWIERNGRRVNAKSIMGVMMLAASKGSKITLEADGKALNFADHLTQVPPVTQVRTDPMHLTGTATATAAIDDQKTKRQYETAPVGNSVVLEEQMVKLADAQSSYQLMTNLYRKHVDMLKMALGRGS